MTQDNTVDKPPRPAGLFARMRRDRAVSSAFVMYALIVVCAVVPAPYLIEMPGPVFNTLGEVETVDPDDGDAVVPVMQITGAETFESDQQLDMLTVGVAGGPSRPVVPSQLLWSVARGYETVIPSEVYYPLNTTRETISAQNAAQMSTSQDTAVAAALNYLGTDYQVELGVASVQPGTAAEGVLEAGDIIRAVNGEAIAGDEDGITRLQEVVASGEQLRLDITRIDHSVSQDPTDASAEAPTQDMTVELTPSDSGQGPRLGVNLGQRYDFPIDVTFNVDEVGGPSAGLIFALTVIDKLTEGDIAGTAKVAGTGTITPDGQVGPIGGARQKVYAANEADSDYFLSPADNCAEVAATAAGTDLHVVKVSTLEEAKSALDAIATGNTAALPACQTP